MAEAKTKPTGASVEAFLDAVPNETRRSDSLEVLELMRRETGVEPMMWGPNIVGFGRYRYVYASGHSGEWPIIGFSPRKADLVLYIMPEFDGKQGLLDELGKHRTGKSCLYIKRLADVDREVLERIVRGSVKAMAPKRVD